VTVARLALTALDCAEPEPLAEFWAALLDGTVVLRTEQVVVVKTGSTLLGATRVPGYTPPTWPGGDLPKRMHLDLAVRDLDDTERTAVELGARKADEQPQPDRWRVFFDPAGHPFCLTVTIPFDL
jgi:hypothetical protein